jgi:NitT/TauT family transport system ATP-binding protein
MPEKNELNVVITCLNLCKDYSSKENNVSALKNLTFSVSQGEFVCVVGPSGCGKSTLLRIIADLIPRTSGKIILKRINTERPNTAMVFQSQGLFPWMTVLENAALGLEMQGLNKHLRNKLAIDFLEKVGLKNFINSYPHTLSGGMRQKVAISRAFLADPEILLMDEPFGMLDAQTRIVMQEELLNLWQDRRRTVMYITHDIEEAIFLGDRILVMSGRPGRLLADIVVDYPRPRARNTIIERSTEIRLNIWNMLHDEVAQDLGVVR